MSRLVKQLKRQFFVQFKSNLATYRLTISVEGRLAALLRKSRIAPLESVFRGCVSVLFGHGRQQTSDRLGAIIISYHALTHSLKPTSATLRKPLHLSISVWFFWVWLLLSKIWVLLPTATPAPDLRPIPSLFSWDLRCCRWRCFC